MSLVRKQAAAVAAASGRRGPSTTASSSRSSPAARTAANRAENRPGTQASLNRSKQTPGTQATLSRPKKAAGAEPGRSELSAVAVNQLDSGRRPHHTEQGQRRAFSPRLYQAQARLAAQRQLGELQLEAKLLQMDLDSADVTHLFYLAPKLLALQESSDHLRNIIGQHHSLILHCLRSAVYGVPMPDEYASAFKGTVKVLSSLIETEEESPDSPPAVREDQADMDRSIRELCLLMMEISALGMRLCQLKEGV